MNDNALLPRLRPLKVERVVHDGDAYFALGDPLGLSPRTLLVPEVLGPLLMLLDGRHSPARARAALLTRWGIPLAEERIRELVATLSEAFLLHDAAYESAVTRMRAAYQAQPHRPPALAGGVYPAERTALTRTLHGYEGHGGGEEDPALTNTLAGLISPHIDYGRGGPVYGALFRRAAPALRAAEVAVIFGTDHHGSAGTLTLTHLPYATPWGVLPTDRGTVEAMAAALGEEAAFAEELHHREEHSVELAAVWLHHVRDGAPLTVIPVLCGHPQPYLDGEGVESVQHALDALRTATAGRRVVAIAAADLAHVGTAFGDERGYDTDDRVRLRHADEELLAALDHGPAAVLRTVKAVDDRHRICGLSPIALTLAFTGPVRAETTGYDQCPSDYDGGVGSFVSIAGVLLRRA